jgi:hypothetical protein
MQGSKEITGFCQQFDIPWIILPAASRKTVETIHPCSGT